MKKLFYFSALLLLLIACEEKSEQETPVQPEKSELEQIAYQMEVILGSYSDYDTAEVVELLSDKEWKMWSYLKYDATWSNLLADYYAFGKMNADGLSPDIYHLEHGGGVSHEHSELMDNVPEWVTDEGEWSFDAATKELILLSNTFYLEAVSPDLMVLRKVIEYVDAEPSCIRLVYIVQ